MHEDDRVITELGSDAGPRYWPIKQYGVIGDCRTAALVAPNGSIDWLCLPHFDSPAILCRLLDADRGGFYRVAPVDPSSSSMTYLPGTNILETTFQSGDGRLRLVDFMPIRKRSRGGNLGHLAGVLLGRAARGAGSHLEREAGNDVAAAHRVARMATCVDGHVRMEITLKPTFDYARSPYDFELHTLSDDVVGAILASGERRLVFIARRLRTVTTPSDAGPVVLHCDQEHLRLRFDMSAGHSFVTAAQYARTPQEASDLLARLAEHSFESDLEETLAYWREWSAQCRYDGTYQYAVLRSALALKLCTFEPTGAIVAAPTTSLPEGIGGVRNWDYRYTWLRDSAFTLDALERLGYNNEARDYFHFLHDLQLSRGDDLRIMYGIRGETDGKLEERTLEHLEGYRGSRPVRVGNGAAMQRQLDIYGELLGSAHRYVIKNGYHHEVAHRSLHDLRSLATYVADYVADHWQDTDRGIWEVRGAPRPFVYSRVMCWVALDRAIRLANHHGHERRVKRWSQARDAVRADVMAHGYDEQLGSFVQSYGSNVLDAANLRIPLTGFLPFDDPHIVGTIENSDRVLSASRALLYRYRTDTDGEAPSTMREADPGADDGLPGKEGAFLACGFWLVDTLCHLGRIQEARTRFEQLLSFAGPLGLFAEEADPDTGDLLGNYPQAFTHIGLINCAVTLQLAQQGSLDAD